MGSMEPWQGSPRVYKEPWWGVSPGVRGTTGGVSWGQQSHVRGLLRPMEPWGGGLPGPTEPWGGPGGLLADGSEAELELVAARHHPEGLEQLLARTQFTKRELQSLYRGFKNVSRGGDRLGGSRQRQGGCLTGVPLLSPPRSVPVAWWTRRPSSSSTHSSSPRVVSLGGDTHGTPHSWGTAGRCGMVAVVASPSMCPPPDASSYAHFLFDAFDADHSGTLCFQVSGHRGATQAPPPVGGWVPGTAAQPGVGGGGGREPDKNSNKPE